MISSKLLNMLFAVLVATQLSSLSGINYKLACAQPMSVLNRRLPNSARPLSTSISTQTKLFSKTRMFLMLDQNGKVGGTVNCSSQYVQFEMQSVSTGLVRLKGVQSGRYLAMESKGYLYSNIVKSNETVFKNVLQSSGYHTFASNIYYRKIWYDTFVALRNNGATKNGRRTNKYQKSVQFLMIRNTQC